ncbi:MAG TPA: sigma-54-dependent Fis family transcriptional regulator [Gammaproteobacteria bacterium]
MNTSTNPFETRLPEVTTLLDGIEDPAVLLGLDYRIIAANRAYRDHYGDGRPLQQRHCYEISHHYALPCDQVGENCPLKNCLASGQPQRVLHLHHTHEGEEHVDVALTPIRDEHGTILYFLEKMRPAAGASSRPAAQGLVGRSAAFNRMLELVQRVAHSDVPVLLLGESGTGKELVANAIHNGSARAKRPFVPVDCSGLTETLFESELFGHEKGAFTGAHSRKLGLVESAQGGTLFLDEVGDIPLSQQVKLLRLLETGTYRRVGSAETQIADFRLILATHRDLKGLVDRGEFRPDLFYRISAFPIPLPPLRERREDLPLLIESLLQRIAPQRELSLQPEALACLQRHDFPGNIRELRNRLERAALLADGDRILPEHLSDDCARPSAAGDDMPGELLPLEEMERRYLTRVVATYNGDRRALAEKLGISERTLYRKLQQLRIE